MRKFLLLLTLIMMYAPFGLTVQAETDTDNQSVEQMLINGQKKAPSTSKNIATPSKTEIDQGFPVDEAPKVDSQFSWLDFVKMFFALAVVIALIYIILRFVNKRNRMFGQMKTMENLGGISLGPNRSIQLVRIGDNVLVVGVGDTIQLLKEITSQAEIDKLISQNEVQQIHISETIINKILPKNKGVDYKQVSVKSFSQMLKGQLEDVAEGRKKLYEKIKRDQDE